MMTELTPSHLTDSPLYLLHRAVQCSDGLFHRTVNFSDLTPRQFVLLTAIGREEGASQTRLVKLTGIDRSTLADVVRRLIQRGYVRRQRCRDDARAYEVRLTNSGQQVLAEASPQIARVESAILAALPADRAECFRSDLQSLIDSLEKLAFPSESEVPEVALAVDKARDQDAAQMNTRLV